jgi:osmoprotectant transport system permease protein
MVAAGAKEPVVPSFGSGDRCVVENHAFCWSWVSGHWGDTLQPALIQHIELTLVAVGIGFAIALGTALVAYRRRWLAKPVEGFSALLYTIPSLALFQILVPFTGITTTTVEIALVAYTLVMLFPNIVAGLNGVPAEALDAARAMGFTRLQALMRIELPLAVPAIVAGLRVAVVSTVSLATIAAFLLPKGLGYPIFLALKEPSPFRTEIYAAGALAIALALAADFTLVVLGRVLAPWTKRAAAW